MEIKKTRYVLISFLVLLIFAAQEVVAVQASLSTLFKQVKESVVVIYTVERGWETNEKKLVSARGIGSGVIISDDGLIMTAAHVVQVADALEIHFRNGTSAQAVVVSSSPRTDLALLRIKGPVPKGLKVAEIGDSGSLSIGESLFAIGAPHGVSYTLTSGHVSNILSTGIRALQNTEVEVILTDAGIDVGNSGGPLFNMKGQVVGIISQFFPFDEGRGSMGAAVAIRSAQDILLRDQPFWSGMELYVLPKHLVRVFNLPSGGTGALVQRIAKGSPAEIAGLKAGSIRAKFGETEMFVGGDIITKVDGLRITGEAENSREILECLCKDQEVTLTIFRDGKELRIKLAGQG